MIRALMTTIRSSLLDCVNNWPNRNSSGTEHIFMFNFSSSIIIYWDHDTDWEISNSISSPRVEETVCVWLKLSRERLGNLPSVKRWNFKFLPAMIFLVEKSDWKFKLLIRTFFNWWNQHISAADGCHFSRLELPISRISSCMYAARARERARWVMKINRLIITRS